MRGGACGSLASVRGKLFEQRAVRQGVVFKKNGARQQNQMEEEEEDKRELKFSGTCDSAGT